MGKPMKRLFSALLLFTVLLLGTYANAESNPLLTVFEGIKVGIEVKKIKDAVHAYGNQITEGIYYEWPSSKPSVAHASISWTWIDPNYKCNGCIAPTARLEVIYIVSPHTYENGKIINVVYKYSFLELEKTLIK